MDDADKALQAYYEKMLSMQYNDAERILTPEELKEIALEIGMTEEDWQKSQVEFQERLKGGKNLTAHLNFDDAISELEQAVAINPYHVDAVYSLANAYMASWKKYNNAAHKKQAENYIARALKVQPSHAPTLRLKSDLMEGQIGVKQKKWKTQLRLMIAVGAIIIFTGIGYGTIYNLAVNEEEELKKATLQIENVYQRRASLIPKFIAIMSNSPDISAEDASKLEKMNQSVAIKTQEVDIEDFEKFSATQEAIREEINTLLAVAAKNPKLEKSETFRNLKAEIDGSDNRISVEKKKFNDKTDKYNKFVKSFPFNLLGFKEKKYFGK